MNFHYVLQRCYLYQDDMSIKQIKKSINLNILLKLGYLNIFPWKSPSEIIQYQQTDFDTENYRSV